MLNDKSAGERPCSKVPAYQHCTSRRDIPARHLHPHLIPGLMAAEFAVITLRTSKCMGGSEWTAVIG
jgi:hypothetical protein